MNNEILQSLSYQADGKVIFSKDELKNLLGVSRTTIDKYMKDGLPFIKMGEGKSSKIIFTLAGVAHYLEMKQVNKKEI